MRKIGRSIYSIRLYLVPVVSIIFLVSLLHHHFKENPLFYTLCCFVPAGWHLINRFYNGGHARIRDSISILHDTFWVGSPFEITAYLLNKLVKLVLSFLIGCFGVLFICVDIVQTFIRGKTLLRISRP